jgi:hypothetical protein
MKTEEIKMAEIVRSNVEVGSLVARRVDPTHKYRVVHITTDYRAITVSKHTPDTSAILDLRCSSNWLKVIEQYN